MLQCPNDYSIFNYKCYNKICPNLTKVKSTNECQCSNKFYKVKDLNNNLVDICLDQGSNCRG